ncbi:hypothetical protein DRP07_02265 [Archaeoglobales archaeon]|nr:MAG: hypothetical protein DRP07_02265 [Archaeoglobales archaeon]
MMEFEDRATEKGLRLVAVNISETVDAIEISLHRTSKEGDFIVVESIKKGEDTYANSLVFKNYGEVIAYITKTYGENNLDEFKEKAEILQNEMYLNKYIRQWKGRNEPF